MTDFCIRLYVYACFEISIVQVRTLEAIIAIVNDCRAFHFYRKDKKKAVKKHPELERLLAEEFRTMNDFRRAKEKIALEAKEKENLVNEDSKLDKDSNVSVPSQSLPEGT